MDELIGRLVANVGIDGAVAQGAIGIILDFPAKEGSPDKVQTFSVKLRRAPARQQQAARKTAGSRGDVMRAGMRMVGVGLGMGEVQRVPEKFIVYAHQEIGEDEVGEFIAAIHGLAQFV